MYCKICTEGTLVVEFVAPILSEETGALGTLRIKNWVFTYRRNQELLPRSALALLQEQPALIDNLLKNIARNGLTMPTLHYLKLASVLEPMQEIMARYKAWNGTQPPRECLRAAAQQKSQQMRMGGGGVPLQQQYQPQTPHTPNTPLGPQQRVGPPLMHSPADDLVKNEPKAGAQNAAAANQGSLVSHIYRNFIRSVKFVE